jgi:hypothetical protein
MEWALTASLMFNALFLGIGMGIYLHAQATGGGNTVDTVQGSVVAQDPDDSYEAERVGFRA